MVPITLIVVTHSHIVLLISVRLPWTTGLPQKSACPSQMIVLVVRLGLRKSPVIVIILVVGGKNYHGRILCRLPLVIVWVCSYVVKVAVQKFLWLHAAVIFERALSWGSIVLQSTLPRTLLASQPFKSLLVEFLFYARVEKFLFLCSQRLNVTVELFARLRCLILMLLQVLLDALCRSHHSPLTSPTHVRFDTARLTHLLLLLNPILELFPLPFFSQAGHFHLHGILDEFGRTCSLFRNFTCDALSIQILPSLLKFWRNSQFWNRTFQLAVRIAAQLLRRMHTALLTVVAQLACMTFRASWTTCLTDIYWRRFSRLVNSVNPDALLKLSLGCWCCLGLTTITFWRLGNRWRSSLL